MGECNRAGIGNAAVLKVFPSFVWRTEVDEELRRSIGWKVVARLAEMTGNFSGLEHGRSWQSDPTLGELPEFRELVACAESAVSEVLRFLRVVNEGFRITGCWANVNAPGAGHPIHVHPNNYLSGVYYVQVPAGGDTVNFHDPRPQAATMRPPVTELTAENTDQVVITIKEGTLLVFPAWLQHSVSPNRGDRSRISVSFNAMLRSAAEELARPQWDGGYR
jgi:uncharacterized protein (TIGR02466 family)